MGYNTSPALVEDNAALLTRIKASIDNRSSIKLEIPKGVNISSMQYKIRRILAATDHHPDAAGGMFHGLGARTTVRVEFQHGRISVEPRGGIKGALTLNLSEMKRTEANVLGDLPSYSGSMITLQFTPTERYNEKAFTLELIQLGWVLHPNTMIENDDGSLSYVAERQQETSGFDILDSPQEG